MESVNQLRLGMSVTVHWILITNVLVTDCTVTIPILEDALRPLSCMHMQDIHTKCSGLREKDRICTLRSMRREP
jgi:hypothetical protein